MYILLHKYFHADIEVYLNCSRAMSSNFSKNIQSCIATKRLLAKEIMPHGSSEGYHAILLKKCDIGTIGSSLFFFSLHWRPIKARKHFAVCKDKADEW